MIQDVSLDYIKNGDFTEYHTVLHPTQSPDLNPIENLWDELDHRVHERPISSIPELRERLQEEWAKLSLEYIQKLISSMPKRMQTVTATPSTRIWRNESF